jgi:tetratricopeptide (TPR) repeat protein
LKINSLARALAAFSMIILSASLAFGARSPLARQDKAAESVKKGDELYKAGKFKEAIDAYKEALTHDPNNDQAIGYIAYSYNKLGDGDQARQWMKRRVEIPGQTPSKKAQVLTDMTLVAWDMAHMEISVRKAGGSFKPADAAAAKKLLIEAEDSGQKAVAIAPRSAKAFNLLNLIYRASESLETDPTVRAELTAKADEALRKSVQIFEALPQPPTEVWFVPTISTIAGTDLGQTVHFGQPTKKNSPDALKDVKDGSVVVEVLVGRDGKVRFPRILSGQGKLAEAAIAAAKLWEFEPTTFEGHAVQVIETISLPAK